MQHLLCPVCHSPLNSVERTLRCAEGHSFDRAKEGYYNLLLAQQKRSREPGDDRQMVQARRRFLEQGHYAPFAEAVCQLAAAQLPEAATVIDAGCGEGYYTAQLFEQLNEADVMGFDIAKEAVRLAAKRNTSIQWLVSSIRHIPVADQSADLIVSLFSPLHPEEFLRVLKPSGELLVAGAGSGHLMALREALYPEVRDELFRPEKALADGFTLTDEQSVNFTIQLDQAQLADLLTMTPHHWRATAERKAALLQQESFTVDADIVIKRFQRSDTNTTD